MATSTTMATMTTTTTATATSTTTMTATTTAAASTATAAAAAAAVAVPAGCQQHGLETQHVSSPWYVFFFPFPSSYHTNVILGLLNASNNG